MNFAQKNHRMELISFSEKESETMKKGDSPREGCTIVRDVTLTEMAVKIGIQMDSEKIETEMEVILIQIDEEQYIFDFE